MKASGIATPMRAAARLFGRATHGVPPGGESTAGAEGDGPDALRRLSKSA
ncbi:MAG: hypothetical protein IPO75_12885 [Betaproteobacteria bacterium]|nr:hypothetical protein [Betaproteobacteria bacterium]